MRVPVPAEYLGRARDLRRRLAAVDADVQPAMRRALMPVQRRLQRHPVVRKETLTGAERAWMALPPFGRVHCMVNLSDRRAPLFDDLRISPGIYRGIDWDDYEPGLAVTLTTAAVVGTALALQRATVAVIGLHCLGRRFQRAPASRSTDAQVLVEIGELALRFPTIAAEGGEFQWPAPDGVWCGHTIESREGEVVISVRTFLDRDATALAA